MQQSLSLFLSCRTTPTQAEGWICPFMHRNTVSYFSPHLPTPAPKSLGCTICIHISNKSSIPWVASLLFPLRKCFIKEFSSREELFSYRTIVCPVVGSLQPVRANLIQEGCNSHFLIPPWKKCFAHSGCRVLSLRGEAASSEKRNRVQGTTIEDQAFASAVSKGRSDADVRSCPIMFCCHPGH